MSQQFSSQEQSNMNANVNSVDNLLRQLNTQPRSLAEQLEESRQYLQRLRQPVEQQNESVDDMVNSYVQFLADQQNNVQQSVIEQKPVIIEQKPVVQAVVIEEVKTDSSSNLRDKFKNMAEGKKYFQDILLQHRCKVHFHNQDIKTLLTFHPNRQIAIDNIEYLVMGVDPIHKQPTLNYKMKNEEGEFQVGWVKCVTALFSKKNKTTKAKTVKPIVIEESKTQTQVRIPLKNRRDLTSELLFQMLEDWNKKVGPSSDFNTWQASVNKQKDLIAEEFLSSIVINVNNNKEYEKTKTGYRCKKYNFDDCKKVIKGDQNLRKHIAQHMAEDDINYLKEHQKLVDQKKMRQQTLEGKQQVRQVYTDSIDEDGSITIAVNKGDSIYEAEGDDFYKAVSSRIKTQIEKQKPVIEESVPVVIDEIAPVAEQIIPVVIEESVPVIEEQKEISPMNLIITPCNKRTWSYTNRGLTYYFYTEEECEVAIKRVNDNRTKYYQAKKRRFENPIKKPAYVSDEPKIKLEDVPDYIRKGPRTEFFKFIVAKRAEIKNKAQTVVIEEPEVDQLELVVNELNQAIEECDEEPEEPRSFQPQATPVEQKKEFVNLPTPIITLDLTDDEEPEQPRSVQHKPTPIDRYLREFNECEQDAVLVKVRSNIDEDDSNGDEEDEEIVTAKPHILKEVIKRCKSQDSLVVEQKTTPFHNAQALKRAVSKQKQEIKLKEESAAIQDKINGYTVEELKSILSLYEDHSSDQNLTKYTGSVIEITCNKCHDEVHDIGRAKVVCKQCLTVRETNTVEVKTNYELSFEDITKEPVLDFRPIQNGYKLQVYCPTKTQPMRIINIQTLKFYLFDQAHADLRLEIQGDKNYVDLSIFSYKQAQEYIAYAYKNDPTKKEQTQQRKELSIFKDIDLSIKQIEVLYQQNPRVGQSKSFAVKMQLDYNVKFEMNDYVTGFFDIETSACDKEYRDIPKAINKKHSVTMIQTLYDYNDSKKESEIIIYHLHGYQYDMSKIREKFEFKEKPPTVETLSKSQAKQYKLLEVDKQEEFMLQLIEQYYDKKHRNTYKYTIQSYKSEKTMIDAFFNHLMQFKTNVIMSGFNASHSSIFGLKETADTDSKDKYSEYNKFHGYDLNFLTARSGYRFKPQNTQMKMDDTAVMSSQIEQLPNVLFVDYQGLILNGITDAKIRNKIDDKTLKGLLSVLFDSKSEINEIDKIPQDMYQLQKKFHEQTKDDIEKIDLTDEFIYSVNDVVCLHRCDQEMGYISQRISQRMEINKIGASSALTGTTASMNLIQISQLLIQQGLNYHVVQLDNTEDGITGAFTNNDIDYIYKVTQCVIQNDYNSLYPSVMILYNICYTTFICTTENPEQYSDRSKFSVIDISDDKAYRNNPNRTYSVFTMERMGILKALSLKYIKLRNEYKAEAKKYPVGTTLYNKYNSMQLEIKTTANAMYGSTSSKTFPYYQRVVGCSITAAARFALSQLNRGVHQLNGFKAIDSDKIVEFIDQEAMTQVDKVVKDVTETEWVRNYHNVQKDAKSIICQNDTDSSFFAVSHMQWFKDALKDKSRQAELYNKFNNDLKEQVSKYTQGGKTLQFDCEEFIVALLTSKASKSYARLDIAKNEGLQFNFEDNYITILNDITVEIDEKTGRRIFNKQTILDYIEEGKMVLSIKGVNWSCFDSYLRDQIRGMFLDLLLSDQIWPTVVELQVKLMLQYQESIVRLIQGDKDALQEVQHFARRIKLTGKNGIVQHLTTNYKLETSFVYCLPLRQRFRGQKKQTLWIPIQYITADNHSQLDDQSILATFNSQMTKFFSKQEGTAVTRLRDELASKQEPDEILVRVEKGKSRHFHQELVQVDQLRSYIEQKAKQGCTLHEVLMKDELKLYFDIDKQKIKLGWFEDLVKRALQYRQVAIDKLEMFVVQRETSAQYASYHITFNVVMHKEMVKQVAIHVRNMGIKIDKTLATNWIDEKVYGEAKTIRMPFCYKTDDYGYLNMQSRMATTADMKSICATYTEGYQSIAMPMCFSNKPIIEFTTDLDSFNISSQFAPQLYKDVAKCFEFQKTEDKTARFIRAKVIDGIVCPCCAKLHDPNADGFIVSTWKTRSQYGFQCFKQRLDGKEAKIVIPLASEQLEEIKKQLKEMKVNTKQRIKNRFIATQCIADKVIYNMENKLTFVQSNMGVGKTQQLIELLKKYLIEEQKTCVMLSVRETLSSDFIRRYSSAGIEIADYRQLVGKIRPEPGKITIIQVDSLARISADYIDILVLDEMQSIMEQLTSDQIKDTSGVQLKFIDMLKISEKSLCMDANLRETTVDLIESFVGEQGKLVWNNYKKYTNIKTKIRPLLLGKQDHILEHIKDVVFTQGKNIVCNFSEIKMAEKVVKYLRSIDKTLPIKFYHGDNKRVCHEIDSENGNKINIDCDDDGNEYKTHKDFKSAEFKDVNIFWKRARVVIYTSTLSSGVNFTESHFHENISCFTSRAGSADMFTQGLMRCRNLIDNKMTIYIDKQLGSKTCSTKSMYLEYQTNMNKYKIVDTACTSDLFNFQMYMQAYKKQQAGCYTDIIVSSCNEMGMQLEYEEIEEQLLKKNSIGKKIITTQTKLVEDDVIIGIINADEPLVQLVVCEAYLNKKDEQKENQILKDYNGDVQMQYKLIQFVSTIFNKQMKTLGSFETAQALLDGYNMCCDKLIYHCGQINEINPKWLSQLVKEYHSYLDYGTTFKVFAQNGEQLHQYTPEQLNTHLEVKLKSYNKTMSGNVQLKFQQAFIHSQPKYAPKVELALQFLQMCQNKMNGDILEISLDMVIFAKKHFGVSSIRNYGSIFKCLGLWFMAKLDSRPNALDENGEVIMDADDKPVRKYLYKASWQPYFDKIYERMSTRMD